MDTIKKYKKIIIISILTLICMLLHGKTVNAKYKFKVTNAGVNITAEGHFRPYSVDNSGFTFYCIQHGSPYRAKYPDKSVLDMEEGEYSNSWCPLCVKSGNEQPVAKPWEDRTTVTMTYERVGSVNAKDYQDAAYVMAKAVENGQVEEMITQWSLWNTSINAGHDKNLEQNWGDEAKAFKAFYESIHVGTTDIYKTLVSNQTNKDDNGQSIDRLKVQVDQETKTYIVGPFKINYPFSSHGNQYWSYIKNIYLLDQDNKIVGSVEADKNISVRKYHSYKK